MVKIAVLVCLLSLSLSWSIKRQQKNALSQYPSSNNLQFTNYTGNCITPSQINMFIISVNDATIIYGDDLNKSLNYLSYIMNTKEASSGQLYNVFIQRNPNVLTFWSLYSSGGCNIAAFSKINKKYQDWSYLFVKGSYSVAPLYYTTLGAGKGPGINSTLENNIYNTIIRLEKVYPCDCGSTNIIQTTLKIQDGQYWNIICDNSADVAATLALKGGQWIYMQPVACHYLIYVV